MSSVNEETKRSLPVGHPQAGYPSPAHDGVLDTGTVPDAEQEWYDERVKASEEQNKAVAENEDKVAKEEAEAAEEKVKEEETAVTSKSSKGSSGSSSSS